jgi:hypothetical protein
MTNVTGSYDVHQWWLHLLVDKRVLTAINMVNDGRHFCPGATFIACGIK